MHWKRSKKRLMAEKSIKKNFIFNLIYQLLVLIAPFVVTPYVSRVLGVEGVGEFSYANSIVAYFLLIAVLGTTTYGQRSIGYVQKDIESRSRTFWEIFLIRLITSFVTLGAYLLYVFFLAPQTSFIIYLILALNIFNVITDITWFMQGMEEFGKTATTSIIFRILSIVSIFLFVKVKSDLWKYVLLSVSFTVVGNMTLWLFLPKYLCKVDKIRPFREIKSVLQLFLPTIAVQIYTVVDKSMIGWFSDGYTENGYYEQADKIVKMVLMAVTALGTVMIPRISLKYKEGDIEQVRYYLQKSYRFVWMMATPIMLGLIVVANVFVPIFFGVGYEKCSILIQILSVLSVFIGLSNVTGMQYFVPTGKQNVLTMTVIVGAVVNVIFNLILIPFFASIGAAIASIVAEFCVTLAGFIYVKKTKQYPLKQVLTCSWKYLIAGIVMAGIVFLIKWFIPVAIWSLIVLIAVGAITYFLVLLILKDALLTEMLSKVFGLLHRKKSTNPDIVKEEGEIEQVNDNIEADINIEENINVEEDINTTE